MSIDQHSTHNDATSGQDSVSGENGALDSAGGVESLPLEPGQLVAGEGTKVSDPQGVGDPYSAKSAAGTAALQETRSTAARVTHKRRMLVLPSRFRAGGDTKATTAKTPVAQVRFVAQPLQTGVRKRNKTLDGLGWFEVAPEPIDTTTRQAEALRLAVARRAGSERSLLEGLDLETGELVFTDPGSDYLMADGSRATTRIRLGGLGEGKTTGMVCSGVIRPLLIGRMTMTLDRKPLPNSDVGEYTPLCEALGVVPLRFATDGSGLKINVLDKRISKIGSNNTGAGQMGLLRAVLHEALDRPLTEKEGKALRVALETARAAAQEKGVEADIRHIVPALLQPTGAQYASGGELREWGLDMGYALERCIEEDLAGLIDGPTDPRLQLNPLLTSFDISSLPNTGPALGITMAIISTWTAALLKQRRSSQQVHSLTDEAWWLTRDSFGEVAQRNIKFSRAHGAINEYAFHHLSDIKVDSPAMSIIKEAGTVMIYKQDKEEDAQACEREFGLPAGTAERLKTLNTGCYALWQSGRPLRWVQHLRSDIETRLTDTDGAFSSADATDIEVLTEPAA